MEELIQEVLIKNKAYTEDKIQLSPYCLRKMSERQIDEDTVIATLLSNQELFYVGIEKKTFGGVLEDRYKLIYKISSRYSLIIVVAYYGF